MATLNELLRGHTSLQPAQVAHLQRLVGTWGPLADLCFADLLLLVANRDGGTIVVGQVRPTTSQTVYREDMVGRRFEPGDRPIEEEVLRSGQVVDGRRTHLPGDVLTAVRCIPVRSEGRVVAVVSRESAVTSSRPPGELERTYLRVFDA
jgi:hypothetical protein